LNTLELLLKFQNYFIPADRNATVAQTALNCLLCKPGVSSVIVGIRTPQQIADNLKTTDWQMLPEEMAQLDKVSKPAIVYPYDFLEHVQKIKQFRDSNWRDNS
jgi:aryl-alcohol dehydrogenase-like predicted oxidoreductase